MIKYIIKKVAFAIPLLFGITVADYFMMSLVGSPLELLQGPKVSAAALAAKEIQLGLDQPFFVQYFVWLKQIFSGNFGTSIKTHQLVSDLLLSKMGPTLLLMGTTLLLSLLIAFPIAIYSASHQYSKIDYLVTTGSFLGISIPSFFLALVFIYIFTIRLKWFPSSGMTSLGGKFELGDLLRHMAMPVMVLVLSTIGNNVRYIRSAMLEILDKEYILTAKAKGIGRFLVINKHALRNALPSVVTVIGMQIPMLMGGSVIIEQIFSWPGLGMLTMSAVVNRDYPIIMAVSLLSAVIVVVTNLITDILYAVVDPTVRLQ